MMVILDVLVLVVLLEQAIVIVITLCVARSEVMIHWRHLRELHSGGTINEVIWGFVFCTETDITWVRGCA